jgi:hypothetical protein
VINSHISVFKLIHKINFVRYVVQTVLQGMTDRLTEIEKCYGMEMNVEKTKVMRTSRQTSPIQIMINHEQPGNVE